MECGSDPEEEVRGAAVFVDEEAEEVHAMPALATPEEASAYWNSSLDKV